jgi:hypothetical protein
MTTASEHRPWAELDAVTQAALRCKDPRFRAFLKETYPRDHQDIWDQEEAAHTVRAICEIDSRRELANDLNAQAKWRDLDDLYQAWLARER